MSATNDPKAAGTPVKPVRGPATKPEGFIVRNPNLNNWRCVTAAGKEVLSTGSKETAMRRFPTFVVKE